ncbi:MAG: hypothetical protein IJA72_05240, partial [Clostridia bacterium]|nr:hypothetical protein [Clostridia bacterium]
VNNDSIRTLNNETEQNVLSANFALKRLFEFSKIVLNEINSFTPQVDEIVIKSVDKKIPLADFASMLKIISIKNQYGYVKYLIIDEDIVVEEDDVYTITYSKFPNIDSILNEINLPSNVGEDVLINGLNSYYCLAVGLFNEFNIYNERYRERLTNLKNLKVFKMPCRSWQ